MSHPLPIPESDALDRIHLDPADPSPFLEARGRELEARLAQSCAGLGDALGPVSRVIAEAVGVDGAGGSRWRPLLTLAAAELFGSGTEAGREAARDVAVAVELTHTASLVLDDMPCMDDSPLRRGQPATHTHVGSAGAILVALGLLGRAAELLGRTPGSGGRLARDWGEMIGLSGMSGGQAIDVAASGRRLFGAQRRLHRAKSTVLPAFALEGGARAAGANEAVCASLRSFGRSLGWAYQLRDDAADQLEDEKLGKRPAAERPLAQSHRILRFARHRLRRDAGLSGDAVAGLIEVADRLVPQPVMGTVGPPEAVASHEGGEG